MYFHTLELSADEVKVEHIDNWWEAIKKLFIDYLSTLRIRAFRRQLGVYMFGKGSVDLYTAVFTYYIVFAMKKPATLVSGINSMAAILQLGATAVFRVVMTKKGFKWPFTACLCVVMASVVAYACLYWFHVTNTVAIIFVAVFISTFIGGVYYTPWAIYPFIPDVDEAVANRRREGVYSAAMTLCGRLMQACYVFLMGMVLNHFGFVKSAKVQPTSAVRAIIGVCFMATVGLILVWKLN